MKPRQLLAVILTLTMIWAGTPTYAVPKTYWDHVDYQFRYIRWVGSTGMKSLRNARPDELASLREEHQVNTYVRWGATPLYLPRQDIPKWIESYKKNTYIVKQRVPNSLYEEFTFEATLARKMGGIGFPPNTDPHISKAPAGAVVPTPVPGTTHAMWIVTPPVYGYRDGFQDTYTTSPLCHVGNYWAREDFAIAHPDLFPEKFQAWSGTEQDKAIPYLGMINDDLMYDFRQEDPFKAFIIQNPEGPFIYVYDFDRYRAKSDDWELHDRLAYGYASKLTSDNKMAAGLPNIAAFTFPPVYDDINNPDLRALRVLIFTRMYLAKLRTAKVLHPAPRWKGMPLDDYDVAQIDPTRANNGPLNREDGYNTPLNTYWNIVYGQPSHAVGRLNTAFYGGRINSGPAVQSAASGLRWQEQFRSLYILMSLKAPDSFTYKQNYDRYVAFGEQQGYVSIALWAGQGGPGILRHFSPMGAKSYYPYYEGLGSGWAMFNAGDHPIVTGGLVYGGFASGFDLQRLCSHYGNTRKVWDAALKGPFMIISNRTYEKYGHKYFEGLAKHPLVKVDGTGAMVEGASRIFLDPEPEYIEQLKNMDYFYIKKNQHDPGNRGAAVMKPASKISVHAPNHKYVSFNGVIGQPAKDYSHPLVPVTKAEAIDEGRLVFEKQRSGIGRIIDDIQKAYKQDQTEYPGQSMLWAHYMSDRLTALGYQGGKPAKNRWELVILNEKPTLTADEWKEGCTGPEIFEYIQMNEARIKALIAKFPDHAALCENLRAQLFPEIPHFVGNPNLFLVYYKYHEELMPFLLEYRKSVEQGYGVGSGEMFLTGDGPYAAAGSWLSRYRTNSGTDDFQNYYTHVRDNAIQAGQMNFISGGRMKRLANRPYARFNTIYRPWLLYFTFRYGMGFGNVPRRDNMPTVRDLDMRFINLYDPMYLGVGGELRQREDIRLYSLIFPGMYKYYDTHPFQESLTSFAEFVQAGKYIHLGVSYLGERTLAAYRGDEGMILTRAYLVSKLGARYIGGSKETLYRYMLSVPTEHHEYVFSSGLPTTIVMEKYRKVKASVGTTDAMHGYASDSRIPKGQEEWVILATNPYNLALYADVSLNQTPAAEEVKELKKHEFEFDKNDQKEKELKREKMKRWQKKYGRDEKGNFVGY